VLPNAVRCPATRQLQPPAASVLVGADDPPEPGAPPVPADPPSPGAPPDTAAPPEPAEPPTAIDPPAPAAPPVPAAPPLATDPPVPAAPPLATAPPMPADPPRPAAPPVPAAPPGYPLGEWLVQNGRVLRRIRGVWCAGGCAEQSCQCPAGTGGGRGNVTSRSIALFPPCNEVSGLELDGAQELGTRRLW
jgi:hypothetical protein